MVKEIYYCDICGKEYVSPASMQIIHISDADTYSTRAVEKRDICLPCFSKICEYVHTELEKWNNN